MEYLCAWIEIRINWQVGACIANVNEERVISTGYNGFPQGCHDQEFPWKKNKEKDKIDPQTKDPYGSMYIYIASLYYFIR